MPKAKTLKPAAKAKAAPPAVDNRAAQPVDVHVGHKLRALRRARNLTQDQLAEACAVSFQQVQKYENGTNRISVSRLVQLAQALKVEPTYFFEELVSGVPLPAPDPLRMAAKAIYERARRSGAVLRAWDSLNPDNPWDAVLIDHAYAMARDLQAAAA